MSKMIDPARFFEEFQKSKAANYQWTDTFAITLQVLISRKARKKPFNQWGQYIQEDIIMCTFIHLLKFLSRKTKTMNGRKRTCAVDRIATGEDFIRYIQASISLTLWRELKRNMNKRLKTQVVKLKQLLEYEAQGNELTPMEQHFKEISLNNKYVVDELKKQRNLPNWLKLHA